MKNKYGEKFSEVIRKATMAMMEREKGTKGEHSFKEVKHFHPSGESLPNGSHHQKGGFLNECRINRNSFTLDDGIHGAQNETPGYRGGMIVFAANETTMLSNDSIKQFIETTKDSKCSMDWGDEEHIGAYETGNFFKGRYVDGNGKTYDKKSVCIEINGLSGKSLLKLAEMMADRFNQGAILVKDLNTDRIFINNLN